MRSSPSLWLLFASMLGVLACSDPALEARMRAMEKRLAALEAKPPAEAKPDPRTWRALADLHVRVVALEDARREMAPVSCEEKGYSFVATQLGNFTVSCEDLRPFGDGFKVVLRIGNPHSVTLNGVKLTVRYGPRVPLGEVDSESAASVNWKQSLREKETTIPDTLRPNAWNKVEVVLAPAKAEDVAFLAVGMEVDRITLRP